MFKNNTEIPKIFYEHRVSYGETDAMGIVYYAEYAHIFERARNAYGREIGIPYTMVEERGIIWPVTEFNCRYKKPARYDDLVQVCTCILEWRGASFKFGYEMYDETKEILMASGYSVHACINKEGKPIRIPDWIRETFGKKKV